MDLEATGVVNSNMRGLRIDSSYYCNELSNCDTMGILRCFRKWFAQFSPGHRASEDAPDFM